jgi:hypothetical protein
MLSTPSLITIIALMRLVSTDLIVFNIHDLKEIIWDLVI